jgi:tetratricopeptide (TPR) repeat protein
MPQVTIDQAVQVALEHHRAGRLREAESIYRQVLTQVPNHVDANHLLGVLAGQAGHHDLAIQQIQRAITLNPSVAEFHVNISEMLRLTRKLDDAVAHARRAIQINPNFASAYASLGLALGEKGQIEEAITTFNKATHLQPNDPMVWINFGNLHWENDHYEEALALFRRAATVDPNSVEAHWSIARVLLQLGQLAEGWEEFEWRFKYARMRLDRGFPQPRWDGSDLTGKTILVYTEGGLGDAVNFIRLLPFVAQHNGKIILECQPAVQPLFEMLPNIEQIIPRGQPLPAFDCQIALQSLPRLMHITLDNIPNQVPYLQIPKSHQEKWSGKLPNDGKLKVGVVWCGVMYNEEDFRSRSLEVFHPLLKIPDIHFVSLQKGNAASEKPSEGVSWFDFSADLNDFADTGALIQNLDLVISVDTSVAHLAAALAKPTWVLIPAQSDFRWLLNRTDSPWYPTMRLFRQPRKVPWPDIFQKVTEALAEYAAAYNASHSS